MPSSSASFYRFSAALLDAALPPPVGSRACNNADPSRRLEVCLNSAMHSRVAQLSDTFPVLRRVIGGDTFAAMARLFALDHPPTAPLKQRYGAGLPAWLEGLEPAARPPLTPPFMADLAGLEWAVLCAANAADAEPIKPETLAALTPQRLAEASLALHPSLNCVHSQHPVVWLWQVHQQDGAWSDQAAAEVRTDSAESAWVFRGTANQVVVLELPKEDVALTSAIAAGLSLGQAQDSYPRTDAVRVLKLLLQHGLVTGLC